MDDHILALANQYISQERNPTNIAHVEALVLANNRSALHALLSSRIQFGTAGLRSKMAPGFAHMNDLTIIQTTQGLVSFLRQSADSRLLANGVMIGFDHRHNSFQFARLAAAVFIYNKIKVFLPRTAVHTPMVPFAVSQLKLAAGIMITASHNPRADNGYKLYAANGCQIIPPTDAQISQHILENLDPLTFDYNIALTSPLSSDPLPSIYQTYFDSIKSLSTHLSTNNKQHVTFVYTPMHGIGLKPATIAFKTFNLNPFIPVLEQAAPDPDFPTVPFPNPEEKNALNIAIQTANAHSANIILANDPDADRLAVAERLPSGSWHIFSGNEVGILFASFIASSPIFKSSKPTAMLSTTVSSIMLSNFCRQNNIHHQHTLTGFKYLGNTAIDLESKGYNVIFAYEEAIGYMIGSTVHDKDGISALVVMAEHTNHLYSSGSTLYTHLQSLYRTYGYYATNNGYVTVHDPNTIVRIFDAIRYGKQPVESAKTPYPFVLAYPTHIMNYRVTWIRDLTIGYDTREPGNVPSLPVSSSTQMITFELDSGAVVTLRTSGTEPKIKWYSEWKSDDGVAEAQVKLDVVIEEMKTKFLNI